MVETFEVIVGEPDRESNLQRSISAVESSLIITDDVFPRQSNSEFINFPLNL